MNNQTKYWLRRVLLFAMIAVIGLALYQAVQQGKGTHPQVGDTAPDFQLPVLNGKPMYLHDLRGKAVMINFWGSWCPPCRQEMPAIEEVYKEYKGKGFEIVAINIGETDVTAAGFAGQYGLTFPIWMDHNRDVVHQYGINPIPTTYFVDTHGVITKVIEGPLDVNQLSSYIEPILPRK